MKNISYYIGTVIGYVIGFFKGCKAGVTINALTKKYGSFERIPTRELYGLNIVGEEMVRRQRMKLAVIILQMLLAKYKLQEIPKTVDALCLWLDNEPMPTEDKQSLDNISKSDGVVRALVDYAIVKDELNIVQLLYVLKVSGKGHFWEQLKTNHMLIVN